MNDASEQSVLEGYSKAELLTLLEDCRSYITPTSGAHEEISTILGWCDCGYCSHVSTRRPEEAP